ncbi:hypothetical protein Tco_0213129 [Tanacetum coccineum]
MTQCNIPEPGILNTYAAEDEAPTPLLPPFFLSPRWRSSATAAAFRVVSLGQEGHLPGMIIALGRVQSFAHDTYQDVGDGVFHDAQRIVHCEAENEVLRERDFAYEAREGSVATSEQLPATRDYFSIPAYHAYPGPRDFRSTRWKDIGDPEEDPADHCLRRRRTIMIMRSSR